MTTFHGTPYLVKGDTILIDAETDALLRIITLQYNHQTMTRTLHVQGEGAERRDYLVRLKDHPLKQSKSRSKWMRQANLGSHYRVKQTRQ